jgi:hypothetical protein
VVYLTDNDIVEKLAIYDLLENALASLGASPSDVYVLPTLKHRIGGKVRTKATNRLGVEVVDRILEFLGGVNEIRDYSLSDQLLLDDVVNIDPGEAILLAATGVYPISLLLTGDKRCLRAIATCPDCKTIALRIRGKVICFEQILLRLIEDLGFEQVLAKVVAVPYCDTALRAAFGSGIHSTQPNTVECLQSYIKELRNLPIDLLVTDL